MQTTSLVFKMWSFLHLHLLVCKQWSELLIKHRLFHLQAHILLRLLNCAAAGGAFWLSTPLVDTEYLHYSAAARSPNGPTAFAKSCVLDGSIGVLCTEVQQQLGLWKQLMAACQLKNDA